MKSNIDLNNLNSLKEFLDGGVPYYYYAFLHSTPDVLMAMTKLFYPDFFEYDDCVFMSQNGVDKFDKDGVENYKNWLKQLKNDKPAVQRVMNHIHLIEDWGMGFSESYDKTPLSNENIYYLGDVLVQTWRASLRNTFPDKTIHIEANRDEIVDDVIITFWADTPEKPSLS